MEFESLIIGFIALQIFILVAIIFWLKRIYVSSTEGAINRLNHEIAKANAQQIELSKKVREADATLEKRKAEAQALADKINNQVEEEAKGEREKIISKAREEGEEIIAKAQNAKEKIRRELESEFEIKAIQMGMKILGEVLSEKAKGALNDVLIAEFLEKLKQISMDRITPDVKQVDVVTPNSLDSHVRDQLTSIIKQKLGREISINPVTDRSLSGGVILKFGSLALDGSIKNLIRESAVSMQQKVEDGKV